MRTVHKFGCLGLLVWATVLADSVLSAGFWSPVAPLPTTRSLHGVAVVDGIIYAVGGSYVITCVPRPACLATAVAAFDPRTGAWSTRAATATRKNHGTAAVGSEIYVMGGDDDFSFFNSVEVYRPASDTWEARAPMPSSRSQLSAAEANGIIYALGGSAPSTVTNQNEAYDPVTNSWSTRAPMPTARYHLSAASLNGLVYAIGGSLRGGEVVATVEVYDPVTNAWSSAAPLPRPISGAATVARGGRLYVTGGVSPGVGSLRVMYVYDPAVNAWTAEPDMGVRRAFHGAAAVDDRIYVVGGSEIDTGGSATALLTSVEAFLPTDAPAPSNLTYSISGATLILRWSAPVGAAPTSYVVEAGSAPFLNNLANFDTGSTATTLSVGSVPAGTYYVRVRARRGPTVSGPSNEVTIVIGGGPCPAPPAPTGFIASAAGNTVTLAWNPVAGALSFIIEAGSAPGATNFAAFDTGSTATAFSASAPNGTYFLRVRVRTSCGTSAPSNEVVLTVGGPPPGASVTGRWIGLQGNGDGATSTPNECGVERWDWQLDLVQTGAAVTGTLTQTTVASGCSPTGQVQTVSLTGSVAGNTVTLIGNPSPGRRYDITGTFTATRMTGTALANGGEFGRAAFAVNRQ